MIGLTKKAFLSRGAGGYDTDAKIFFGAVIANGGVLTKLEKDAYNVYRIDAKNNADAWNGDCHIDLPMLESTVESMVINAQQPGTFDQIAVNTVAGDFTANGWNPNGTDSYFKMGLLPFNVLTIQSVALEYYSRDEENLAAWDMGSNMSISQRLLANLRNGDKLNFQSYDNNIAQGHLSVISTLSAGGVMFTRIANNDSRAFRKGVQVGITLTTSGGIQPKIELYLGCFNSNGNPTSFTTRENAGAGIYDGLTPAKVLAQYNARQLMNTNCVAGGRQV